MNKKGITLVALVVTIIVLLILIGVTLGVTLGENGIIEKSKRAKLDSRYGSIMDKVKLRETALEIAFEKGQEGETDTNFIERLEREGLKTEEDEYEAGTKTLTVAGIYTIHIADASADGRKIWQRIQKLPTVEEYPDMAHMTLRIRTTISPETVILPISYGQGLTIDWGDGQPHTTVTTDDPNHSYTTAGNYTLKIMGKATHSTARFGKAPLSYTNTNIIGIKYWGENDFKMLHSFGQNLQGEIVKPSRNSFKEITSFSHLFHNCIGLTGNIPPDLFINCSNITDFQCTFQGCSNLTESISEDLFINCSKLESFNYTFDGCSNLTGNIPPDLFSNSSKVTNFQRVFSDCSNLTGSIPPNLFRNCLNAITFHSTFYRCSKLTGNIPSELFLNCPKVKTFIATFDGCNNLTGSIPSNLFSNCSEVTSFSLVFSKCSELTGDIPENLFLNCSKATNFYRTFYFCNKLTGNIPVTLFSSCININNFISTFENCKGLTGDAPELWNIYSSADSLGCFRSCTGLSNFGSIPPEWR